MIRIFQKKIPHSLFVYLPLAFGALPLRAMETESCSSSSSAEKFSISFVTVPTEDVAKNISHGLVKNQLAACVNIIPKVKSVYMWKGEVNEDNELILKIKTRSSLVGKVTDFVKKNHPYEVCEVISVPIEAGNPDYLKWIGETVPEATQSKTE